MLLHLDEKLQLLAGESVADNPDIMFELDAVVLFATADAGYGAWSRMVQQTKVVQASDSTQVEQSGDRRECGEALEC